MDEHVIYPPGCEPISAELGADEMIYRLQTLAETLKATEQDYEAYKQYIPLALHIAQEQFLSHPSRDVQLLIACCIANFLKVFEPEALFQDSEQAKTIFLFLITHLTRMNNSKDPVFKRYLYLLESLAYVKSFNMCFDLQDCQEIFCTVYPLINNIVNEEPSDIDSGHINHIPLQQLLVTMLENAITLADKKTSDSLKKTSKQVDATKTHNDKREEVKDIISKEIAEHKSDLAQVKIYIEKKFNQSLGPIDNAYIEEKYIKYCAWFWIQETTNFLKKLTEAKSRYVIQEIFHSLDNIQGLSQIPNPLNQLEYYSLLMQHYKLVRSEDEIIFIGRFKKECLEKIVDFSDSAKKELMWLEVFINLLRSKNLQSIIVELELQEFCRDNLSFAKLINNIMKLEAKTYGENLTVLQETTEGLKEGLFFIDNFKKVIDAYLKPTKIEEKRIDNRLVVALTGNNVIVSEILQQLENKLLENSDIEEIHLVGGDIIHIDTNFKGKVWKGKNVVILTKIIKIHDKVTWDVSGKNNNHVNAVNAGTDEYGYGKRGDDGYPGESGGNVLILTDKIKDPENFTIISNGGKGSEGQDGGNGKAGEDGKGITKNQFDEKFPPVANLLANNVPSLLKKTIYNIKDDLSTVKDAWYGGANTTIESILQQIESNDAFYSNVLINDIFIEAATNEGNNITFSFVRGGFMSIRQAFFLYKGSLGKSGKSGGEYGYGGQGGYAGEITEKNLEKNNQNFGVVKIIKQGEEGKKGHGGFYGSHGKNGWDMGYLDYRTWSTVVFCGTDQNSKCTLEYYTYDNNPSDRIWCPYKKKYAGITDAKIEHQKQKKYEERKRTSQNRNRQHHALAARKKNVSQGSIFDNYSHHFSSVEKNTLQGLRANLENTKQQALQTITENQEQQQNQTTELRIERNFLDQKQNKHSKHILIKTSSSTYRELDEQAIELHDTENFYNNTDNNKLQDKYRLAILQQISKQLPSYQEVTDNIELRPKSAAKFLVEVKENNNNISHAVLGTLNQYFYENSKESREKISQFAKEALQDTENKALKYSIREFVLEVAKSQEVQIGIKNYYNEYNEFFEKKEQSLNLFYKAFKNELFQPRHAEIYDLWIESVKDKSLLSTLEKNIQKDVFLKGLYNRFNNQLKLEYDWNRCCHDQAILKEFDDHIPKTGPLSGSYRELLAYIFDSNIRLYAENQDNRLFLQGDHNPSSKRIIYMLCRSNEIIPLEINKNYLKLESEHQKKDCLFGQILADINSFKQKQEFDDYLINKGFLSNNSPSEDEQSFNEEEDIEKILEYFPEGIKQQLKGRLDKITSEYIGRQGILHYILTRFSVEGRYFSSQELFFLINSILSSLIEDKNVLNIFCWIVAAYPQKCWTDELILLQLENYFKKILAEKPEWRNYLSKIENKDILLLFKIKLDQHNSSNPISTQCIESTLRLLSNIPNETVSLEGLDLSEWPYALKEKYWASQLSKLVDWQKGDLSTASYYLLSMENIFGTLLSEKFIKGLEKKKQELSPNTLTTILSNFHSKKWNLTEKEINAMNLCGIDEWAEKMVSKFTANKEERKITQLVELIKGNGNTSEEILNTLPKIKNYIESIEKSKIAGKLISSFAEDNIRNWVKEFQDSIQENKRDIKDTHKEILAVIDRAIELKRGFKLRDTQKLTVLALLTTNRNTLAQVSTGEGKSLIVVASSIMKAICGEKIDIITSSTVLAKRDAESNRDIYNLFDINVSHNCSEDIEKRKEAYSGNQVVYGDLSNFQRDYLLDKFYGKNILGDRNFENIIVDEVDSMLLDKGKNILYLSHDLAGLDKLESVYIYIWQWINRPAIDPEEISYAFDTQAIKEAVLNEIYDLMKKEDIEKLGSKLDKEQQTIIWERLIKAKVLDDQGKILKENFNDNELNKVLSTEFNYYKERLHYLLKECIEREKFIHVPNNLRPFIEQHLESWINSAITAFCMKAGEDYVVDVDKTGTSLDRNPNITILDRDTGTDQANSQWDEALHQFLQLKHGCKLSLQSLKAVFISNVSFFKLYRNLYGLTGTLGSQRERNLLQEIHSVDFVTVPTAKFKQFCEDKPILCTGKEEWINRISNKAKELTEEKKRSVLIICETVHDVEILYKDFQGKNTKHVSTYTRDYEEFDKGFETVQGNKELGQEQIIIATNLAGRGTDIKITKELASKGGLHVCLTYLPNNIRIEEQAFGRAARCGGKGSGQLIIMDSRGQEYSNLKVLDLKKERDTEEFHRLSDIKACYDTQITIEERCFKAFKEQYEQMKKDLDGTKLSTEIKEILLQSCLDKWAFWLDENSKCIKNLTNEQSKRNFDNLLSKFIKKLKNLDTGRESLVAWVKGNPVQMVKLGRYFSQDKKQKTACETAIKLLDDGIESLLLPCIKENPVKMVKLGGSFSQDKKHKNAHENSIELFDEVINKEPYFSETAHYYKAFALVNQVDWEQKPLTEEDKEILKEFKLELLEAARLLDEHSKFAINASSLIGKIKKNNKENIIQTDAYQEQQKNLANLYYMFSRSIDDIFGHTITSQSFVNSIYNINEELAQSVYKDLLEIEILKKPSIEKCIAEKQLKVISLDYGVSVEKLQSFLSKYKGKEIFEKEFQKSLKTYIPLPDRNAFWKLLIQGEVLGEEVKYVEVNNEKLKEIDPSLLDYLTEKIKEKVLKEQTLELINEHIFLNADRVTQQKNNSNTFKKDDFINIVGKDKYKVLKEKGVFSFNRKARIDPSKIGSISFPCYDSITLEDFVKLNISKKEAEEILAELVKQNVVKKKENSQIIAYGFNIKYDEIKQVRLPSCPVYENDVKGLLSTCFTYRLALQRIETHLKEENYPVRLQLIPKPYQYLALELLEQKVIRPVTVTTKDEDLEEKLKGIYSRTMTNDKVKRLLSQSKLIPIECIEKLFDCLLKNEWIIKYDQIQSIKEEGIRGSIGNTCKSLTQDLYYINSPEKRQKPLCFLLNVSKKSELIGLQTIDKTVEKVLDNQLKLAKKDTIKDIVSTLKRSRSSLNALNIPDVKLKPFTEPCEFTNIAEAHLFSLNGLDQLLQFEEKKWTREMLVNTAVVAAMGISQIAIGTAIELYSVGVMTHVGAAFVSEGVSDLFFAAGALKSGYFSWEDYRRYKLESLMITAATAGIGAFLSRGAKVSRFGNKLAGPNFEFGKKVAEMSGTQLIETAGSKVIKGQVIKSVASGWKVIGKEVAKRITLKTIEGAALGLANAGVETLIENYVQALCKNISSEILSGVERKVEEHEISLNLEKTYNILGKEKAKKIIETLTKSVFTQESYVEEFLLIANKIVSSVTQGIAEAVKKRSKTSNKLELPINAISQIVVLSERSAQVANITMITSNLLNNLDREIKERLNKLENDAQLDKKEEKDKDYKSFKNEIIDHWKLLLHERAGQIIATHIVRPIFKKGAHYLVRYVGKAARGAYHSYKESKYFECFEQLKQEYNQKLQNVQECDNASKIEKNITKIYHKELLKLMTKTKNPKLFAAIVRENVPMDMTCISACTTSVHNVLKKRGIEGLTIIVEGEGGIRQEFCSAPKGVEGLVIKLELKDNHFQIHGNSMSENNKNIDSKNNCLFEALSQNICLNMTPEDFRANIANCIEHNPYMQHHVRQGWHQFPIFVGAFGGERAYDEKIPADELNKRIADGKILFSQSSIGDHTSDKGGRKKMHVSELAEDIKKDGWKGKPIKAVKKGDKLIVLDHRRTVAAATIQSPEVQVPFAVYEPDNEFSSESCEIQYGTPEAGQAVKNRMRRGSLPDCNDFGFVSSDVRIRTTRSDDNTDTKLHDATFEKLKEMNFQVGGPSRKPRSRSLDRSYHNKDSQK